METPTQISYSSEGYGAIVTPLAWELPATLTAEQIGQAKRALPAAEATLRPASRETISKWLVVLGSLCAGQTSAADAKTKISAYAQLLQVPEAVLTKETLREAGEHFRWLPSFAEISAFLEEKAGPMKRLVQRLEAIANAKPSLPPPPTGKAWSELSDDEKAALQAKVDAVKDDLSRAGPKPLAQAISVPPALKERVLPRSEDAKALIAQGVSAGATGRESAA